VGIIKEEQKLAKTATNKQDKVQKRLKKCKLKRSY